MPGLMEYVSPISPASRVWLGLPAREAALILAPHPADSGLHSEQLIRHGAAEAPQDRCRDERRRFQSLTQPERPVRNTFFTSLLEDWYFRFFSQMCFYQQRNRFNYFIQLYLNTEGLNSSLFKCFISAFMPLVSYKIWHLMQYQRGAVMIKGIGRAIFCFSFDVWDKNMKKPNFYSRRQNSHGSRAAMH